MNKNVVASYFLLLFIFILHFHPCKKLSHYCLSQFKYYDAVINVSNLVILCTNVLCFHVRLWVAVCINLVWLPFLHHLSTLTTKVKQSCMTYFRHQRKSQFIMVL